MEVNTLQSPNLLACVPGDQIGAGPNSLGSAESSDEQSRQARLFGVDNRQVIVIYERTQYKRCKHSQLLVRGQGRISIGSPN